jgi:hypothetical protein
MILKTVQYSEKNSDENNIFYGEVKFLISQLLTKFNNDKLCFILPLSAQRKSTINEFLSSYINFIKELCTENGIDFLDLINEFNNKELFKKVIIKKNIYFLIKLFHNFYSYLFKIKYN